MINIFDCMKWKLNYIQLLFISFSRKYIILIAISTNIQIRKFNYHNMAEKGHCNAEFKLRFFHKYRKIIYFIDTTRNNNSSS